MEIKKIINGISAKIEKDKESVVIDLGDNYTVVVTVDGVLVFRDGDVESNSLFARHVVGIELTWL